jgi:hypothetical protein
MQYIHSDTRRLPIRPWLRPLHPRLPAPSSYLESKQRHNQSTFSPASYPSSALSCLSCREAQAQAQARPPLAMDDGPPPLPSLAPAPPAKGRTSQGGRGAPRPRSLPFPALVLRGRKRERDQQRSNKGPAGPARQQQLPAPPPPPSATATATPRMAGSGPRSQGSRAARRGRAGLEDAGTVALAHWRPRSLLTFHSGLGAARKGDRRGTGDVGRGRTKGTGRER